MPPPPLSPDWLPWGGDAFEQARDTQRPILLTIGTTWSLGCAELNRTTYRDPSVLELVDDSFVPVWVDADDRPDIGDRYGLGGWPTTAFLTADGQLLGGQTFTEPSRMADLLARVAQAFAARRVELGASARTVGSQTSPAPASTPSVVRAPDLALEPWLVAHLQEVYDDVHGGFGRASKRLQPGPLLYALAQCKSRDTPLRQVVTHTIDAAAWGPLFDDVDGGLFRYAARRDWTEPAVEKLLTVNAGALQVLVEGWVALGDARYRDRALDVLRYVRETLIDSSAPGFFASQRADDVYYAADATDRHRLQSPPVDQTVYTGPNAGMVRAFIHAAERLGDSSLLEFAVEVVERVAGEAYQRGDGVARRVSGDGGIRGLLVDQVSLSEALMDAHGATDREVYLDMAQELMMFAMRRLWDTRKGVFVDREVRSDDVGLLRYTITPFSLNCRAAGVLARIGRAADRPDFAERANLALASQTASARSHSVDAAAYAVAAREVCFSETS